MSPAPKRETIYVDAEDEITAVIEKLKNANSKIVALVLPKRAVSLQSAVNLKLLKRAAANSSKNIVLISSDETILSLAGLAGVHVAKTLQSKPAIPNADSLKITDSTDETVEQTEADEITDSEAIEVDTDQDLPAPEPKTVRGLKRPNIKIPNFEKFRLRLIIGVVLLILLIGGWVWASIALPKAKVVVKTDTNTFDTNFSLTASLELEEADLEKSELPAVKKELEKTGTQTVDATGQRDEGTRAKGTMTLTNCIDDGQAHTIPAGTGFTANGLTFVTDQAVELGAAVYSGDDCLSDEPIVAENFGTQKTVKVTAIEGGEKYNVKAASYSAPAAFAGIFASGSDMKGGTTKIVKVVSQSDIDAAVQAILDELDPEATDELNGQFTSEQQFPLKETFRSGKPKLKSNPEVNKEVDKDNPKVVVSATIVYSQVGISKEHLTKLIEQVSKDQIDETKQVIQNTGLDNAGVEITSDPKKDPLKITFDTKVTAGPQLDEEGIRQDVIGLKKVEAEQKVESRPGIIDAEVSYSPFWVTSVPNKPNKIEIVFTGADGSTQ